MRASRSLPLGVALACGLSYGAAAPQIEIVNPSASRTLVIAAEVSRDGARLIGFTGKPRPFVAQPKSEAPGNKTQLAVTLVGPAGARYTQRVEVSGLCLAHGPETPPEIAGDTIRLHRESFLLEVPEIEGFDSVEIALGSEPSRGDVHTVLGTLALDAAHYTPAGGTIGYGDLAISRATSAPSPPLTSGTVHFPEEFGDPDIFTVYGDLKEAGKRINLVVIPDGYTYAEKATMQAHAQALVDAFRARTPYKEHDRFLNFILVYAYSNQGGTDQCDCSDVRDTAMSSRFFGEPNTCLNPENRCLYYGGGCDTDSSAHIATAELRAPARDVTLVMVNTSRYGGCGGERAVYAAANVDGTDLALHEMAHTLTGLADEYDGNPGCGAGTGVNVSMDPVSGNWAEWIPEIGAPHEGAQYYNQCIYRPAADCQMRTLHREFCPVCRQQFALSFFAHPKVSPTAPIESATPATPIDTDLESFQTFSIETRLASGAGVTNDITWELQGPGYPTATTVASGITSYGRTFSQPGTYTLTSRVVADTNFIKPAKNGENADTASWTVRVCNEDGLPAALNNGPLCSGATLRLFANLLTGVTFSWTGPAGFQSSEQNPTIENATASASGTYFVTVTAAGCVFTLTTTATVIDDGAACSDGNACTQPDICQAGVCLMGPLISCVDADPCTTDSCSPAAGCANVPRVCTASDTCHQAGVCDPTTGNCSNPVRDADVDGHADFACGGDDCNDANAAVWHAPVEATHVRVSGKSPTTLVWDDQRPAVGSGTTYHVASGVHQRNVAFSYFSQCLTLNAGPTFIDARPNPAAGSGYWYLIRAANACGTGTWGSSPADFGILSCGDPSAAEPLSNQSP